MSVQESLQSPEV